MRPGTETSPAPAAPREPGRAAGRRGGLGGPLILCALAALAFLQAILLYPMLFGPRSFVAERESDVNLPGRRIRVLVSRGDPLLILKTPFDDAAADRRDAEMLDRHLFPGGPRHRYYLLCVAPAAAGSPAEALRAAPLVVEDDSGRTFSPVDLAPAVAAAGDRLPAWLRASLGRTVPAPGAPAPAGRTSAVLLAFPETAAVEVLRRARLGDRELLPAEFVKDVLDRALETAGPLPPDRAR